MFINNVEYVEFICEVCGQKFVRPARMARAALKKNQPIRFCSKKCRSEYHGRNRFLTTCTVCGKELKINNKFKNKKHHFCSSECCQKYHQQNDGPKYVELECLHCHKKFIKTKSYVNKQAKRGQPVRYCCKKCANEGLKNALTAEQQNKIQKYLADPANTHCAECGKKIYKQNNQILQAIKRQEERTNIFGGNFCSAECSKKYREKHNTQIIECDFCHKRFKINNYRLMFKHHYCSRTCKNRAIQKNKDNYLKIAHYLRTSTQYNTWRKSVMAKDNWQCVKCKSQQNLQVHHCNQTLFNIAEQYNFDLETILHSQEFNDVENGITLCVECHHKEHPWTTIQRNEKGQFCSLARPTSSEGSGLKGGENLES